MNANIRSTTNRTNTNFASGPCAKRKDWTFPDTTLLGRSHRSPDGLAKIQQTVSLMRKVLEIPQDYFVAIVSGSSTGAMETLLWNLLGSDSADSVISSDSFSDSSVGSDAHASSGSSNPSDISVDSAEPLSSSDPSLVHFHGVDVLASCTFGKAWAHDIVNELRISDSRVITADFPDLCDTSALNFDRDVVFCWSSTTSGASYHNADWIAADRRGLTICDATSAVFSCDLDWSKLDATAFSWQKGVGGEAGIGTIVLSPRAMVRLETRKPLWPIPRIFRLVPNGQVNYKVFDGYTINTPSMLCIEDFYEALVWADEIGGLKTLLDRVDQNYNGVKDWIDRQELFKFLVKEEYRAHHIGCFDITDERYKRLSTDEKWEFLKEAVAICEREGVGHDFLGHISTEPHLRIWMGPTIDTADILMFLPHMEKACREILLRIEK